MAGVDVTALDWMFTFTERKQTPNEVFLTKLEEHVAAGGDPNPGVLVAMGCGYRIGSALRARRAGDISFSEAEWAAAVKFGTLRVLPTPNEVFLTKLEEHVAAGGDPNPGKSVVTSCGYRIGTALRNRRAGAAAFSDVEWAAAAKFGTYRVRRTPNEVFLTKLEEHVAAGGDPNPSQSFIMSCGYQIGKAVSNRRRGAAAFSDAEWAAAEKFGTLRVLPTPNEVFLTKLEEHVAAGGDPNPAKRVVMDCGYQIGQALNHRRTGHQMFTDADWAAAAKFGTLQENPRKRASNKA